MKERNFCSRCFLKCLSILHFCAAQNCLLSQFLHFFLPQIFGSPLVSSCLADILHQYLYHQQSQHQIQ